MEPARLTWHVLRTRSRQEKVVEKVLIQKQINVYLPKVSKCRRGQPASISSEIPLFPGYVFVRPAPEQFYALNFIPGSCGVVMHGRTPGEIQEREVEAIRLMLGSGIPFHVHLGLLPGRLVKVIKGPLAGVRGELVQLKARNRLVLNASILGQAVSVEIDAFEVRPI